ncbi:MAG: AmmeMemoRadiSam system protein B [Candidatus Omnitrophica bacterium]|nr:AmmeMemoRadiSam system protein B [Candidatus Omnitrophota bacterium]
MKREPAVCGQFYPATERLLREQIESMVDKDAVREKVLGVVSPHAGYIYSGPVAGSLFSHIEITDTVVILGPNHTGLGSTFSLYEKGSWTTPLGEVKIDEKLAADIKERCELIEGDEAAHSHEHSLEVQIPFMQYFKPDFKIVPIVVSNASHESYEMVGNAIAGAIKKSRRQVLIVASSDMTHYEPYELAKAKDKIAIDAILKLDEKQLLDNISKHDITMCGYIPTTIMLIASKALGAKSAKLIKYQTSGDISGDYSAVVGYAGVIVQ